MDDPHTCIRDFQLGMSEDGGRCLMVFTDDQERSMTCAADFAQFTAFVSSLNAAAREMVKRQTHGLGAEIACGAAIDVTSAVFRVHPSDGFVIGALSSPAGDVIGLRMRPDVACRLTRDLLLASPAATV